MHCAICGKKVSHLWSYKGPYGRLCQECEDQHFIHFQFGGRKHLPIIEVVMDPLPPGVGPQGN